MNLLNIPFVGCLPRGFVCIWKRGLALEPNTPDTPTFTAAMGGPGSIRI